MKVLIQIIVKFKAKKIFVCVSITKDSFEGHEVSVTRTMVLIWKWKAYLTQPHNFVHDFWKKKYHKMLFSSPRCMHASKVSTRHTQNFFQPLNYLYVDWWFLLIWTYINLQKEVGVSKHSWKKTMQLLWTDVTYLLKNVEYGLENDIYSTYGDIRHS